MSMNRRDFLKVIGADERAVEYMPVACLLRSGYGCAGYFNTSVNQALDDVCTLLNARLIPLQGGSASAHREQGAVRDFNEFIEEVVLQYFKAGEDGESAMLDRWGRNIPLATLSYDEIAVLYPVAYIGRMMRGIRQPPIEIEIEEDEPILIEDDAPRKGAKVARPKIFVNPDAAPSFLDFDSKSVIISMLRKKLW